MEIVRGESEQEMPPLRDDNPTFRMHRRRMTYRRQSDHPPPFWQKQLLPMLLTALLGFMTSVLVDIKRDVRQTSDRQIEDRASYANLAKDLEKANNKIDTVVLAFQWNVNGRLNYLEAKTGFKAPKETLQPPQQPLQGD